MLLDSLEVVQVVSLKPKLENERDSPSKAKPNPRETLT